MANSSFAFSDYALNAIKVVSMFLGSLFGLLGTLKEFSRNKKSIRWKWITIAGIVLTGTLSVVIQNIEFSQDQAKKKADDDNVTKTANLLDDITQRSKSILVKTTDATNDLSTVVTRTQTIQGDLKNSLDSQRTMLTQIGSSAKMLSGVAQSLVPAAFQFSLHYDIAPGSCLMGYANAVRKGVNGKTVPKGSNADSETAEVIVDAATGKTQIAYGDGSPLLGLGSEKGQGFPLGDMWVRFHKDPQDVHFGHVFSDSDGIEYVLEFDRVSVDEKDKEFWKGSLPLPRLTETFTISYIKGVPTSFDIDYTQVNALNNNDAPVIHSGNDLPGTILELEFDRNPGCTDHPRLDNFEMLWGPNYSYSSNFDTSKFKPTGLQSGTVYIHKSEEKDFHFGIY